MMLFGLGVFAFCSWAVFSHRFDDGILVKNFLSFAAIISFLVVLDHDNTTAAVASATLMGLGILIWFYTHFKPVRFFHAPRSRKVR